MIRLILKNEKDFPHLLKEITDPPESLYMQGNIEPLLDKNARILCVVGSRNYTNYGKEVVEKLIEGLKGYNICIVSGLALGIDSIAHRAALKAGLYTAAFPGSGLDPSVIAPATHLRLAEEIVASGGALLSEFKMDQGGAIWTYPQRNRLMAGISHGTLVVECGLQSGTLITSARATDYNRDVAAVPGSIFSPLSAGPHMLISKGAMTITCVDDLLEFLGFARREGQSRLPFSEDPKFKLLGAEEKKILYFLQSGPTSKDNLVNELGIGTQKTNLILSSLELDGFIKEVDGVMKVV
jgi:DNA processing protein